MMVLGRLGALVPVLFGMCVLSFALLSIVPGDPVTAMLGLEADPSAIATLRAKYALDQPIPVRFLAWFAAVLTGDLGRSIQTGRPVLAMVGTALVPTLQLGAAAMLVSLAIAIPAGIVAAARRNTAADLIASFIALCGLSLPSFWLAILLILGFSIGLPLLPSSGYVPFIEAPGAALAHMVLPAITLGAAMAAATMRMTRAAMLEVLSADYIRTARAKGAPPRRVVWRHALRNAMLPVTTLIGLQTGPAPGRRRHHRDRLLLARHRQAHRRRHLRPRRPRGAGRHPRHGHPLRPDQPRYGPALHRARPPTEVPAMKRLRLRSRR